MTQFQISCDKCNRHISVVNLQPGQEAKCWYCGNRQTVPGNTINIQVIKYCKECDREYSNDDEFKYCNKDGKKLFTKEKRIENTPEPVKKVIKSTGKKTSKSKKLTFALGNFLIAMCFIQGCAALFLFVADIPTDMIPDRFTAILTSAVGFFTAYGIKNRRIWGLYLVYSLCIIFFIVWSQIQLSDIFCFYKFRMLGVARPWFAWPKIIGVYFDK